MTELPEVPPPVDEATDRRNFLAKCGRFAIITPPAVTMLLSTSLTSQAIAQSGGQGGGRPGGGGPPGGGGAPGGNPGHGGSPPGQGGSPPGHGGGLLGWLVGLLT